jgi:two-component system cell cycle sensor histidine kinase/response regulator CckA
MITTTPASQVLPTPPSNTKIAQQAGTSLNVLFVEDSVEDAVLLGRELEKAGFDARWKRVETEADFCASLKEKWDIICSDLSLPRFSAPRALELLLASKLDIPFIIVSGNIGEERAIESLKGGATDFVFKDRPERLGRVVKRALREVQERTERKQFEKQFIEAQKMEVIGHLASGVAHDFNNILAVIMGYSDMLRAELGQENPLGKFADEIRLASQRAAGLTRQLLVFSRKQTVQPVVLDLNDIVQDLDKMLRRLLDENIELTIVPGKQIGRIKADSGYVGQILMNLVVNARDVMHNGGKLSIATSNVTLDENYARTHEGASAGDFVQLSVSDTGTGMTDEVKAHLFEAFFTTKPKGKGTGMGLATCQTIIKQCGGHIGVYSEIGKGTTFRIYFPRVEQMLDVASRPIPSGPLPRGTETLLVVEDDPSLRHLARGVLEAQGYQVLSASNGQDALHVTRDHKGAPIRLVVSDVIMPLMGGKVMAEWLKTTYPDLKILFTSGYTDDAMTHHGVLVNGVEFLAKPYTPATLGRKVREMLDSPGLSKTATSATE